MSEPICTSCNLCCDGGLFDFVEVTDEEAARLGGGADFCALKDKLGMRQCCSRQGSDGKCAAYELRPQKCRDFDCTLLQQVEAGEIPPDFALDIVAQTKEARAQVVEAVTAALPAMCIPEDKNNMRHFMVALETAERVAFPLDWDAVARAKLAFGVFATLTDRYFHETKCPNPYTIAAE